MIENECKYEKDIQRLKENVVEYNIKIMNLSEKLDKLDEKLDKLDEKTDKFITEIKNGYIPKRTIETIKQEDELMEKIVGDVIYKKIGKIITGLLVSNVITVVMLVYNFATSK